MAKKHVKPKRDLSSQIAHLERSIRHFGDSDGSRQAILDKLKNGSKPNDQP
jgi:hypothetical protein